MHVEPGEPVAVSHTANLAEANKCGIHRMLKVFRWFAFDYDFTPNRQDLNFKSWSESGLTTFLSLTKNSAVHSFDVL